MSFQNKGFSMVKGSGHINDKETAFHNPSEIEPKRPHEWFVGAAEVDFFPSKKQAVEDANGKSSSGFASAKISHWENNPNLHSVPNIWQLFGSENKPANFAENNTSYVPDDDSNVRPKMVNNQYGHGPSFGLSISHPDDDSETCLNFSGIKRVNVNQVKDSDGVQPSKEHHSNRRSNGDLHLAFNGEDETGSVSIGQAFEKDGDVTLMGLTYNRGEAHIRSFGAPYGKGGDTVISIDDSDDKEGTTIISFDGFPDEQDVNSVGRPEKKLFKLK